MAERGAENASRRAIAPGTASGDAPGSRPASRSAAGTAPVAPTLSLPKGGGAIRGIDEKLATNLVTGTASFTVPIATSPGRSGFALDLGLSHDSGAGNGAFGLGWRASVPAITRKTDKGLPQYIDGEESDVFVLSGAEDLVPIRTPEPLLRDGYRIGRYRPRVEGLGQVCQNTSRALAGVAMVETRRHSRPISSWTLRSCVHLCIWIAGPWRSRHTTTEPGSRGGGGKRGNDVSHDECR